MLAELLLYVSLVNDVRSLIARHDFAAAEQAARAYQAKAGGSPELAAALSWLARGALEAKQLDKAESYAEQARKLSLGLLRTRELSSDPWLPTALGASIEVHAQVLAARGERPEAIAFLRQQLRAYGGTNIGERLRKNLNLLDLVGKPAPPLDEAEWLGPKPPPWSSLRGRVVLLFFWAHWCPDCKADAAAIGSVAAAYAPDGLTLIAPTRLYGYVAGGEPAAPAVEKEYIERVRRQYYPMLKNTPVVVSARSFLDYGASTTPTLVLIDRAGIVRFYHPGAVTEQGLSAEVRKLLGK